MGKPNDKYKKIVGNNEFSLVPDKYSTIKSIPQYKPTNKYDKYLPGKTIAVNDNTTTKPKRIKQDEYVNTTSDFVIDSNGRSVRNTNVNSGLTNVYPEFALLTAGVGSGIPGVLGSAIHGASQGAMWNASNIGGEQSVSGLIGDMVAGSILGAGIKKTSPYVENAVKNTYKINPWAFKPNPEAYYRGIGKTGLDDVLKNKKLIPKQSDLYGNDLYMTTDLNVARRFGKNKQYYRDGVQYYPEDKKSYIAEIPKNKVNITDKANSVYVVTNDIPKLNDIKLYKQHWLKGYKEIKPNMQSKPEFKPEIDWGKWNKEIPENKALMQEYNAIEQQAKANGTWMKNPDGSAFQGTPEQFIQQNSKNFKKAFPNGYKTVYRGEMAGDAHLTGDVGNNRTIFTADKETGQHYAGSKGKLFELYHPESANNLSFNNNGRSWRNISRNHFGENPPELDVLSGRLNTPQTGNYTSTDDIAKWIEDNNKDYVNINNIFDGTDAEFVRMVNHKKGNYLKSAIGNNGMFDMTNPNIYKALIPAVGLYGLTKNNKK